MFGQVVVGPPGSGKTVYCNGMLQFMEAIGRKVGVVNLDPANHHIPYDCIIDIHELVTVDDVMVEEGLGPNGALIYCIEYLEKNIDWLISKIVDVKKDYHYFVFDCPGQVELYNHHESIRNILALLDKEGIRLCSVHLVDSYYCSTPANYISAVTLSLSTMIHLNMPHVNVLSKIDLIESMGTLDFNLDFYTEVQDLGFLLEALNAKGTTSKYSKLNEAVCDVIEDFGLVSFYPLDVQDKNSVWPLLKKIDNANGYCYSGLDKRYEKLIIEAGVQNIDIDEDYRRIADIQEKYMTENEEEDLDQVD
eukprot:TRINITY_DN2288_c0_g1_i2.p1 TRINITY_DN2288_c0_g1~~TRINITY_DN2288_c0_g1_i2.p1  ORF type:complete len:306 (-),score=65.61 TRINITY_DN2288_c0_g1_i2:646-1563(-)